MRAILEALTEVTEDAVLFAPWQDVANKLLTQLVPDPDSTARSSAVLASDVQVLCAAVRAVRWVGTAKVQTGLSFEIETFGTLQHKVWCDVVYIGSGAL